MHGLDATMRTCFRGLNRHFFLDVIAQDRCREADFSLANIHGVPSSRGSNKPIFMKCLMDF